MIFSFIVAVHRVHGTRSKEISLLRVMPHGLHAVLTAMGISEDHHVHLPLQQRQRWFSCCCAALQSRRSLVAVFSIDPHVEGDLAPRLLSEYVRGWWPDVEDLPEQLDTEMPTLLVSLQGSLLR